MASWDSPYAIWRDLSLAQGTVPAEIDYTVAHNERPPPMQIVEETEEHFYSSFCNGDGDSGSVGPDVNLITKMLAEARPVDPEDVQTTKQEVPSTRSFKTNMFARKKTKTSTENSPVLSPTQETTADPRGGGEPAQPATFVPTARAASYYVKFYERSKDQEKRRETIWDRIERQIKEIDERRKLMAEEGEIHSAKTRTKAKEKRSTKTEAGGFTSTKMEAEGITSTKTEAEGKPSKRPGPQGIDRVRLTEHRHNMLTDIGDCVVCAAIYKAYPELVCGVNPTPLDLTPLESVPSGSTLFEQIPRDLKPLESMPSDSTPLEPTPSDSTLFEQIPRDLMPLEPIQEPIPSDSTLFEQIPRVLTPLERIPSDSTPLEPVPSDYAI